MSDADVTAPPSGATPPPERRRSPAATAGVPRLAWALPRVYVVAGIRLALPLLVLPLVASRVGAEEFGRLSFILVWSGLLSLLVEGGFLAAATRLAVDADPPRQLQLARQVFSARLVLSLPVAVLALAVVMLVGDSRRSLADVCAITALAVSLGWPATWYLQATHQLGRWARIEFLVYGALLLGAGLAARSVAAFVMMQVLASSLLAVFGWLWLRRDLCAHGAAPRLWAAEEIGAGLRLGWKMLPVSIAGAAYSFALPAAASAQMPRVELGVYYMADRIARALLAGADPVFSVVYPRIVALFRASPQAALRYAFRWAVVGACTGAVLLLLVEAFWPSFAALLAVHAGAIDISSVHRVLFILAWLWPMLLGWKFFGYWMLGSGRYDMAYRAAAFVGAIAGVLAAATWGGAAGAVGLAWTALGVEALVIAVELAGVLLTRPSWRA
ncbi:MAG: oligosaccharide flippase family protein [Pseudomonadota bacterium]|nr:oligosaccharide flippase family protein [Pseudomonadota bacterium]